MTFIYPIVLLVSFGIVVWCLESCYWLGFAAYHGVKGAARNLLLVRILAAVFSLAFLWAGISLMRDLVLRMRRKRSLNAP